MPVPFRKVADFASSPGAARLPASPEPQDDAGSTPFDPDGVVTFLRRAFPTATALNVQAATAIPAATVDNWLRGRAAPSAAHLGVMVDVFGPTVLSAAFPRAGRWLGGQVRRDRVAAAIAELQAALS